MSNKSKRVVAIADLHCGHVVGLTTPQWQLRSLKSGKRNKYVKIESAQWDEYIRLKNLLCPIDLLIVVGDGIEGSGERSGGTELITTNREEQSEMAIDAINVWNAPKVRMVYGTAKHTGEQEDWEDIIAKKVCATIGSHSWINVNGLVFDVKHHLSSTSVPYGKGTALLKDALWNELWAASGEQPKGDVILRAHEHVYCKVEDSLWCCVSMPALQGMGSKFGSRRCSRRVDWGLVVFDVRSKTDYDFDRHITKFACQKARVERI
jgi:predicted MPP superfamily phosphohydrolase